MAEKSIPNPEDPMTDNGHPDPARSDAPGTAELVSHDDNQPLTRSELEATVARMLDEQLSERLAPLKSSIERLETQKMLRDTDVERNTQDIRRNKGRLYSLELGGDHRDRDVA